MQLHSERNYDINSYDKPSNKTTDELFANLEMPKQAIENNQIHNPKDNTYSAVQTAKMRWKGASHGLNRIPIVGAIKISMESIIGRTASGEKLSPVQRKLYGLAGGLSAITYALIAAAGYTGNPRLASPSGVSSFIASAATAAGQASIAGDTTKAGALFKQKLIEKIKNIKTYVINKMQNNKDILQSIELAENQILQTSDKEATRIVQQITTNVNADKEGTNIEEIIEQKTYNKTHHITEIHYEKGIFSGEFFKNYDFLTEGSESTVYKSKDGSHVIKISEPYNSREDSLYNNRIQETMLGNTIFGNLGLEVIGYYEHNGVRNPVYKQQYIQGDIIPEEQAKQYLKTQGAYEIDNKIYYKYNNQVYQINDFSDNYIQDSSNNIYGIDVTMFKPSTI